jgi:Tfp pilus assembly protein FimT
VAQQQRAGRATQVYKIDELEFDFIRRARAEALKDRRQPVLVCKGAVEERCVAQN